MGSSQGFMGVGAVEWCGARVSKGIGNTRVSLKIAVVAIWRVARGVRWRLSCCAGCAARACRVLGARSRGRVRGARPGMFSRRIASQAFGSLCVCRGMCGWCLACMVLCAISLARG